MNWCVERDLIDASPAAGVKPPAGEVKRERVLSEAELAALWRAFTREAWPFGPFGRLLMLTAARKGEVAGMAWAELDLTAGLWTVPAARAKNGIEHVVPLGPEARAILADLPRFAGSPLVFPAQNQRSAGAARSFSGFSRLKARLDAAMAAELGDVPAWRLHDIRRSVASGMAGLGIPPHVVEKLLNHVSGTFGGVHGVYNRHSYIQEKRDALERWEQELSRLIEDNPAGPARAREAAE